eukprot:sb/3469288/
MPAGGEELQHAHTVPNFEIHENFKAISVGRDGSIIWTLSTARILHYWSNETDTWQSKTTGGSGNSCEGANDLSVTPEGDVWITCDTAVGRLTGKRGYSMDLTLKHLTGVAIAGIDADLLVVTNFDHRMVRSYVGTDASRAYMYTKRKDSGDLAYFNGTIYKLTQDGTSIVTYRYGALSFTTLSHFGAFPNSDNGKKLELRKTITLPPTFTASKLSAGPYIVKEVIPIPGKYCVV